jgi:hypothetical protein
VFGDGGIYSNVEDLARWNSALDEHALLSASEMPAAFTPVKVPGGAKREDGTPTEYGYGWFLDLYKVVARGHGTPARRQASGRSSSASPAKASLSSFFATATIFKRASWPIAWLIYSPHGSGVAPASWNSRIAGHET